MTSSSTSSPWRACARLFDERARRRRAAGRRSTPRRRRGAPWPPRGARRRSMAAPAPTPARRRAACAASAETRCCRRATNRPARPTAPQRHERQRQQDATARCGCNSSKPLTPSPAGCRSTTRRARAERRKHQVHPQLAPHADASDVRRAPAVGRRRRAASSARYSTRVGVGEVGRDHAIGGAGSLERRRSRRARHVAGAAVVHRRARAAAVGRAHLQPVAPAGTGTRHGRPVAYEATRPVSSPGEPVERVDQQHREGDAQRQIAIAADRSRAPPSCARRWSRADEDRLLERRRHRDVARRRARSVEARAMFKSLSATQRMSGCAGRRLGR